MTHTFWLLLSSVLASITRIYRLPLSDIISITIPAEAIRPFAMERNLITDDDQGKTVVDSSGEKLGMVTEVRSGKAYVDADPGLTDSIRSKLGWSDADDSDYALEENRIDSVTDDEIRLKDSF